MSTSAHFIQRERYARRFGAPVVGDVRFFDDGRTDGLLVRRACQYAQAMALKALPHIPGRVIEAVFYADSRLVVFTSGSEILAAFRGPDRVMDFDPHAPVAEERA